MIRMSEAVLKGHPDKFCDQIADAIVAASSSGERDAYCQVEVAAWGDDVWVNGSIATRAERSFTIEEIVRTKARDIGYVDDDGNPRRFVVHDAVTRNHLDPRRWTGSVNDQAIVVGWAGYDERTRYLAPEHFLAHYFREALEASIAEGRLRGEGPDGKLLVRIREERDGWHLEHLLVTLQQRASTEFLDLVAETESTLAEAFRELQLRDIRWRGGWSGVELMINPNGPLISGGSDGDNGQTGRKLVMDYYGPRVAIGGGALSGKHLTHIDRIGAYVAREAAVRAVLSGADECRIVLAYAPNQMLPLDVVYEMSGRGARLTREWFAHDAMRERHAGVVIDADVGRGTHFVDEALPWNGCATPRAAHAR